MVAIRLVVTVILAGGVLFALALYYYLRNEARAAPRASLRVRRHPPEEFSAGQPIPSSAPRKTPPISHIEIPPMMVAPRTGYSPMSLSGMGGSWKPLRGVMPKRLRHFPHKVE